MSGRVYSQCPPLHLVSNGTDVGVVDFHPAVETGARRLSGCGCAPLECNKTTVLFSHGERVLTICKRGLLRAGVGLTTAFVNALSLSEKILM